MLYQRFSHSGVGISRLIRCLILYKCIHSLLKKVVAFEPLARYGSLISPLTGYVCMHACLLARSSRSLPLIQFYCRSAHAAAFISNAHLTHSYLKRQNRSPSLINTNGINQDGIVINTGSGEQVKYLCAPFGPYP